MPSRSQKQNSSGTDDPIVRRILLIGLACVTVVAVVIIYRSVFMQDEPEKPVALSDGWTVFLSGEGDEGTAITLPARLTVSPGQEFTLKRRVEPNQSAFNLDNGVIALRTFAHTLDAYWDGERIYSYGMDDCLYGRSPPPVWHVIDLPDKRLSPDYGELTLKLSSRSYLYRGSVPVVYFGSLSSIHTRIDSASMVWTLMAAGLLLLGVILCVLYAFLRAYIMDDHFIYLGLFVSLFATWALLSSQLLESVLINAFVSWQIAQFALLCIPLAYTLYARRLVKPHQAVILKYVFYVHFVLITLVIVLQVTSILDFADILPLIPLSHLITMSYCGYCALSNRESRIAISGKFLVDFRTVSFFILHC